MVLRTFQAFGFATLLILGACGGGGGGSGDGGGDIDPGDGGGGDSGVGAVEATIADLLVKTYATNSTLGSVGRVDVIDTGPAPGTSGANAGANPGLRTLRSTLSKQRADIDGDAADTNADGVVDSGFDEYETGLSPGNIAENILLANNLYDIVQTTHGQPTVAPVVGGGSGGPGLLSTDATLGYPGLSTLPHAMGGGRGPSAGEQHAFFQIEFPYDLQVTSLFDRNEPSMSFLGDSQSSEDTITIEARWQEADPADQLGVSVDQSFQRRHVSGVAIIGGVCAVPFGQGFATIDLNDSNLPEGCKALVNKPNVLTYVAHESPELISTTTSVSDVGVLRPDGVLLLPDPETGSGGRVFGANETVPSAVNDFAEAGTADAAVIGFVQVDIRRLRTTASETVNRPYFHTFPVDQSAVGSDTRAPFTTPPTAASPNPPRGNFNRGPAIFIEPSSQIPAIDILDPSEHAIGSYNPTPVSDNVNTISTRPVFLVEFDREVVPNSVGFSRRHTLHEHLGETADPDGSVDPPRGVIFPFNGNSRPIPSPATQFGGLGAPVAPSIYVAINVPATREINDPAVAAVLAPNFDNGTPLPPVGTTNGLNPQLQNTLATFPRGVVPCDIYPLNQNNLQAYVVEPLVELPPNSIVTVGVCRQGYEGPNPLGRNNVGNVTRSGTMFTTDQSLTGFGLSEDNSQKTQILANDTIIKVNPGPQDFQGMLFYGGTTVAIDTLMNGDVTLGGVQVSDDARTGGFNIARTFKVGADHAKAYVNAPVSPQAMYAAYSNGGVGVIDLNGNGFTTNAPGGGLENTQFQSLAIVSQWLNTVFTGKPSGANYDPGGSLAGGAHVEAFGIASRYAIGTPESDYALGKAIGVGINTPQPGINEGTSGYETFVKSSPTSAAASTAILRDENQIGLVRDIALGDFLDKTFADDDNPFAAEAHHRSYNDPGLFQGTGSLSSNSIADPPFPNPPPLRFPVGLPFTRVIFDQANLKQEPFLINGTEVLGAEHAQQYLDQTGVGGTLRRVGNHLIALNPTVNQSNPSATVDVPFLPLAGFTNVFDPNLPPLNYVQMGPPPETCTAYAVVLATFNSTPGNVSNPSFKKNALYQSRQQIGNYLFLTDGTNRVLHALNSNSMEVVESIELPDPYGLAVSPDLERLYVSNEGDDSVSVIDVDPDNATFLTETKRIPVGDAPRGISVQPNGEGIYVCNFLANSISIIDPIFNTVRKTLITGSIKRPWDIVLGPRETNSSIAFNSGTFHGFISNNLGNNVLVYESGPDGLNGIGFDSIIGTVDADTTAQVGNPDFLQIVSPRGIELDPNHPTTDQFGVATIACFVAHQSQDGRAAASRIAYTADSSPGINFILGNPNFGSKTFEITSQYISTLNEVAFDVALPDYSRTKYEQQSFADDPGLLNLGNLPIQTTPLMPRNAKYTFAPTTAGFTPSVPRWAPDRLYLSLAGGIIEVYDIKDGILLNTIQAPQTVTRLAGYFRQ